MRVTNLDLAEEFLEKYSGASTGIKFPYQQGKSLKFEKDANQDDEAVQKIREENEAETGCGCIVM
jgi:hypothetical protein